MNQFKKAKQLRSETGQAIESITDLKTAGVTQKAEDTEHSITEEKKVQQNNTATNTLSDSGAATKNNIVLTNIKLTAAHTDTTTDESIKTAVQPITEAKTNEPVLSTPVPDNTVAATPVVFEQSVIEPAETIVSNQPLAQTEAATKQPETTYENVKENIIPVATPEVLNTYDMPTVIPNAVSTPAPVVNQPAIPPYTVQAEYNNIPQTIQQPYIEPQPSQEAAAIKHNKSSKKSVPNIFSPKGEAKSMRKSLVLKPTSVKIAENYCEKNGGSFNELIQTLLDNFIDEYGL